MKKSGFRTSFKMVATVVFGLFLTSLVTLVAFIYIQYSKNQRANRMFLQIYLPSYTQLVDFKTKINAAQAYMDKWIYSDRDTASDSYKQLMKIQNKDFYEFKRQMWSSVDFWSKEEQNLYYQILDNIDSLFIKQKILINLFESPDDFNNTQLAFHAYSMLDKGGDIYDSYFYVQHSLNKLIQLLQKDISYFSYKQTAAYSRIKRVAITYGLLVLFIFVVISISLVRSIASKIKQILFYLDELTYGRLPEVDISTSLLEYREIFGKVGELKEGLQRAGNFAIQIAQNKFDVKFEPLSKDDVLGNALLQLRDSLVKAQREADLRRIENNQRQWASQGIAEFSELLREHAENLDDLSSNVIAKMVDYTVANIGGLYIVNDEDPDNIYIELKAYYAFDRHKFKEHVVKPGDTLIGQCYLEGNTIYMNDVPDDYVKITSGLGSDKPRSILIVPLKVNEQTLGIVELASFEEFEQYQIEFVEKIGEAIASAISTVKINIRTARLLKESNEKTKRLEKQEKEARQQIHRLEVTIKQLRKELEQEQLKVKKLIQDLQRTEAQMRKKEFELQEQVFDKQKYIDQLMMAINNTIGFYELNAGGDFVDANSLYLKMLNLVKDQVLGAKHQMFVSREFISSGAYKHIWDELKQGKVVNVTIQYLVEGKFKLVSEVLTPILDSKGELERVIAFSYVS